MTAPTLLKALKRISERVEQGKGSARILKVTATKLSKRGWIHVVPGSEYRREEWGRPTGPVFVTVWLTELGKAALS